MNYIIEKFPKRRVRRDPKRNTAFRATMKFWQNYKPGEDIEFYELPPSTPLQDLKLKLRYAKYRVKRNHYSPFLREMDDKVIDLELRPWVHGYAFLRQDK